MRQEIARYVFVGAVILGLRALTAPGIAQTEPVPANLDRFVTPPDPPLSLTVHPASIEGSNDSHKVVILVAIRYTTNFYTGDESTLDVHDYYFKPDDIAPGGRVELVHSVDAGKITHAKLIYVQFIDGTSWGDIQSEPMIIEGLSHRTDLAAFYRRILAAGVLGANDEVRAAASDDSEHRLRVHARWLLGVEAEAGVQAMLDKAKARMDNAIRHGATQ